MITVKKFSGIWCAPCRVFAPIMNEVKREVSGVHFMDIDVDDNPEITAKYGVRSVPTVVIEKDGSEVARFAGVQSKLAYVNAINAVQ